MWRGRMGRRVEGHKEQGMVQAGELTCWSAGESTELQPAGGWWSEGGLSLSPTLLLATPGAKIHSECELLR